MTIKQNIKLKHTIAEIFGKFKFTNIYTLILFSAIFSCAIFFYHTIETLTSYNVFLLKMVLIILNIYSHVIGRYF